MGFYLAAARAGELPLRCFGCGYLCVLFVVELGNAAGSAAVLVRLIDSSQSFVVTLQWTRGRSHICLKLGDPRVGEETEGQERVDEGVHYSVMVLSGGDPSYPRRRHFQSVVVVVSCTIHLGCSVIVVAAVAEYLFRFHTLLLLLFGERYILLYV